MAISSRGAGGGEQPEDGEPVGGDADDVEGPADRFEGLFGLRAPSPVEHAAARRRPVAGPVAAAPPRGACRDVPHELSGGYQGPSALGSSAGTTGTIPGVVSRTGVRA